MCGRPHCHSRCERQSTGLPRQMSDSSVESSSWKGRVSPSIRGAGGGVVDSGDGDRRTRSSAERQFDWKLWSGGRQMVGRYCGKGSLNWEGRGRTMQWMFFPPA